MEVTKNIWTPLRIRRRGPNIGQTASKTGIVTLANREVVNAGILECALKSVRRKEMFGP